MTVPVPEIFLVNGYDMHSTTDTVTFSSYMSKATPPLPIVLSSSRGAVAGARLGSDGKLWLVYHGTSNSAQEGADASIEMGTAPEAIGGFIDALSWAKELVALAAADSAITGVYVTGFSLGGTQAQYVASVLKLPGYSIAGAGLPRLAAGTGKGKGFYSFACEGDFWGSAGNDTGHPPLLGGVQNHYGDVVMLGDPDLSKKLTAYYRSAGAVALGFASPAMRAAAAADEVALKSIHSLPHYALSLQSASVSEL